MGTDLQLPLLDVGEPSLVGFLSIVVAVGLPYLVGLLSKPDWAPQVKGVLLLVLALVKTLLEAWIAALTAGVPFNFWAVLYSTGISFLIAVGAYFGLLKNTESLKRTQQAGVK